MSRRAKPVGLIEPSPNKQLLRETVQEIISEGKRMILTTYEYERGMDIFIGNHNIYCARVELFRNREGEWTDYANLDKIQRVELNMSFKPFRGSLRTTDVPTYTIYCWAETYGLLRVYGGRAGLLFGY